MGPAQRYAAELFAAGQAGAARPDGHRLAMSAFPVEGAATTYSADSLVTDSAAAGTALACGLKTSNGTVSMSPDGAVYRSIASAAKEAGMKVGIVSTVSINDATPAVFYAHQPSRSRAWEIAMEQAASGFDYFGGGGMSGDGASARKGRSSPMELASENGYTVTTNRAELLALEPGAGKVIAHSGRTSVNYAIDRTEDEPTLADFTRKGIELLDNPRGFFMMVEGGRIDVACHSHDLGAEIREVLDLDAAVGEACKFLAQHPTETLIVVTTDHETGGLTIAPYGVDCVGFYQRARLQGVSQGGFMGRLRDLTAQRADFAEAMKLVKECYGLMAADDPDVAALKPQADAGDAEAQARLSFVLRPAELDALRRAWEMTLMDPDARAADPQVRALYGTRDPLSTECTALHAARLGVGWATYGHTGLPVPVMAQGAHDWAFNGQYDNTNLAQRLMSLIGAEPKVTRPEPRVPANMAAGAM